MQSPSSDARSSSLATSITAPPATSNPAAAAAMSGAPQLASRPAPVTRSSDGTPSSLSGSRFRPSVLSRPGSKNDDVDSIGYQPSASEDEEVRLSDSTPSLRRLPRVPTSAPILSAGTGSSASAGSAFPPSASKRLHRRPPSAALLSAAGSNSGNANEPASLSSMSHSGGEASASSSRSHLPLQSKTSLYRRQASAASSVSNEPADEGYPLGQIRGSASLSRAKSVSSVSSVNSTSSMEAVPFRAAPLGNVRLGFGGLSRAQMGLNRSRAVGHKGQQPNMTASAPPMGSADDMAIHVERPQFTAGEDGHAIESGEAALSNEASPPAPARQRILPKGPSDDWHYRNAPGLGNRVRAMPHTVAGARPSQQRPGLANAFLSVADADDIESDASSLHASQRTKPSIRSKLAKRAGKLGLKPLTSVQGINDRFVSQTLEKLGDHDDDREEVGGPSQGPPTPSARASPETAFRTSKSYFNTTSASNNLASFLGATPDADIARTTSSVTNAPLVVPKHPPGPPGSGPPPSPGLVGAATSYILPFVPARISPEEQPGIHERVEELDPAAEVASQPIPSEVLRPVSARQGSVSSGINGALGATLNTASNRASVNAAARPPSRDSNPSPSPSLTPAQRIQMEARAGMATVPSEPSGASPGPDPDPNETADWASPLPRRPMSASVSTQQTARPQNTAAHRWSGTIPSAKGHSSPNAPLRPGLLRALTGESVSRRSMAGKDDVLPVDGNRKKLDGRQSPRGRHGSMSPRSHSSTSIKGSSTSPSLLRLDIPAADAGPGLSRNAQSEYTLAIAPDSAAVGSASDMVWPQASNSAQKRSDAELVSERERRGESKRPPFERVDSRTAPSELPSVAVSSTADSVSSKEVTLAETTAPTPPGPHLSSALLPMLTATQTDTAFAEPVRSRGVSNAARSARTRDDFFFGDLIGEGSYSTVMEAWDLLPLREKGLPVPSQSGGDSSNALAAIAGKSSKKRVRASLEGAKVYAIKVLDKVHILKEKKQKYVNVEKEALSLLTRHPGVITLYWTFQDRDSLYFVLELAPNGELLSSIKKLGSFNETCARYYAAQLVDTIEAMHKVGVLHRDIKPENVLLDSDMRMRLADFGSAKVVSKQRSPTAQPSGSSPLQTGQDSNQRPSSFVGTAEYVSPELLTEKQVSEASDYWAFGCIIFQMLSGRPPFKAASEYQTFQKIMRCEFEFQDSFPSSAKDLVAKLLSLDPPGRPTPAQIRSHAFFADTDWDAIWTCPAPTLEAGIYKRPPPNAPITAASSEGSYGSRDDDITSALEDEEDEADRDSRSGQGSVPSRSTAQSNDDIRWATGADDADDDGSSMSDSQQPSFRKRGFSAGASAAERMLAQVSNTTRKGSNNLLTKVTAGLASFDRSESSSSAFSRSYRSSAGSRPSGSTRTSAQSGALDSGQLEGKVAALSIEDRLNASLATSWAALLLPHESLLYACPVLHKATGPLLRTTSKKRQLLLTDFPRLLCVKETNDQLKVKSEVILGLPRVLAQRPGTPIAGPESGHMLGHAHSREASLGTIQSGSAIEGTQGVEERASATTAFRASQMRRQSSAGPLLPSSPSRSDAVRRSHESGHALNYQGPRRESSSSQQMPSGGSSPAGLNVRVPVPPGQGQQHSSPMTPTPTSQGRQINVWSMPSGSNSNPFVDVTQASPNVMTSIESKSIRSFVVHTPARSYMYEDPTGDASHWVKSITMAARRHAAAPPASSGAM